MNICTKRSSYLLLFFAFVITILFILSIIFQEQPHDGCYPYNDEDSKVNFVEEDSAEDTFKFKRPSGTQHLKCDRVFNNNLTYIQQLKCRRIKFKDPNDLPMDCESIRARHYFLTNAMSQEEAEFPIAQIRLVYKDYFLLEMGFALSYAPQNQYCYAIDKSTDDLFRQRIHSLAKCFPNVQVTTNEYDMDEKGHGAHQSTMECFKLLEKREWKYVQLLQNHDISLHSNYETVQILKALNGSNDVEQTIIPDRRLVRKPGWSFEELNLFKNKTRNTMPFNSHKPEIIITKGYFACSLTREFVNFIMNELDLAILIERLENIEFGYGMDELLFPTLNVLDALAAPGGTTGICNNRIPHITRYSVWQSNKTEHCVSKNWRHGVCVFGVEDLVSLLYDDSYLYFNKLLPSFDFASVTCWYERLFNKTYIEQPRKLDTTFYVNSMNVRLQRLKDRNGIIDPLLLKSFDGCNYVE